MDTTAVKHSAKTQVPLLPVYQKKRKLVQQRDSIEFRRGEDRRTKRLRRIKTMVAAPFNRVRTRRTLLRTAPENQRKKEQNLGKQVLWFLNGTDGVKLFGW
jgi:hypothetical protein